MAYSTVAACRDWGVVGSATASYTDTQVTDRLTIASAVVDDYCGLTALGLPGGFAAQTVKTYTFDDVRLPLLSLPRPVQITPTVNLGSPTYTATTATDPSAAWTTNQFVNQQVTAGNSTMIVTANTATVLTGVAWAASTPVNGTAFTINGMTVTVDTRVLGTATYIVNTTSGRLGLYQSGYLDVDGFPRGRMAAMGYNARFGAPYGSQVTVTATFGYTTLPTPIAHATILITAFLLSEGGTTFLDARVTTAMVEGVQLKYPASGLTSTEMIETTGVIEADRLLRPYKHAMVLQVA